MLCSKCGENVPDNALLKHLRDYHSGEADLVVTCPVCSVEFVTVPTFHKHWYSAHNVNKRKTSQDLSKAKNPRLESPSVQPGDVLEVATDEKIKFAEKLERPGTTTECVTDDPVSNSVVQSESEDSTSESDDDAEGGCSGAVKDRDRAEGSSQVKHSFGDKLKKEVNDKAAALILRLKDKCYVPATLVPEVIADTESLIKSAVTEFSSKVSEKLQERGISLSEVLNIEENIQSVSSVFDNIRTEHQQNQYFKESIGIVEPLRIPLGREFRRVRRKGKSGMRTVSVCEEMMYVPITDIVDKLINHPDYKYFLESGSLSNNSDVLHNFMTGEKCKLNPVLKDAPDALRFVLFYDDLEVCSPLKSKSGKQKLGAFYMYLDNIPQKFRSNLSVIFLVALVNANFIKDKKYGMDSALECIVNDLKKFEEGVTIKSGKKVHGTLIATIGDNLGLHAIGGFKEGFTAHRCCRFCLATFQQVQTLTKELPELLRDVKSHVHQCAEVQSERGKNESLSTEYGINRDSILNTLSSYHVVGGLPPDLLHDILEGLLPLGIKRLLNYYLYESTSKMFTLDWLNKSIQDFDFGSTEASDKPSELRKEHIVAVDTTTLHQSACQTWLLATILPMILGSLVDSDEKHYTNFLDALEICRIVFSTEISSWMIVYLQDLIEIYLSDCISLYRSLIPKHHHVTHYPTQILLLGSLVNYMGLRGEAKHKFFKRQVNRLGNYKNISWTLARRHQFSQAAAWSISLKKETACGPRSILSAKDTEYKSLLSPSTVQVIETNWLEYEGNKFTPDKCFICVGSSDSQPVFAKVVKVLIHPMVMFVCKKVTTLKRNIHLAAYEVSVLPELCLLNPGNQLLHSVLHAHKVKGKLLIAVKYCAGNELF